MDMKLAFKFSLVSCRPNVTDSYFLSTINERHVCSPTLSLSGRFSPWIDDLRNTVNCLYTVGTSS